MNEELNRLITKIQKEENNVLRNEIIEKYTPFIIKTASKILGKYIEVENDEELSVALLAFDESINKYSEEKGGFISFSSLVIESRIKDYLRKLNKIKFDDSETIELIEDKCQFENEVSLNDELKRYKKILLKYGINFETLADKSPVHKKTRCKCFYLVNEMKDNKLLIDLIKIKKKLPITNISKQYDISKRVLKYSKQYILSLLIVYIYEFDELREYIEYIGGDCDE
ncbi:sigma factor [Clostridiaceae bacterium HSG29]|nr:sigma factor [Clostridiaceae bacterium HSG29]